MNEYKVLNTREVLNPIPVVSPNIIEPINEESIFGSYSLDLLISESNCFKKSYYEKKDLMMWIEKAKKALTSLKNELKKKSSTIEKCQKKIQTLELKVSINTSKEKSLKKENMKILYLM